jgi:hypothetical protein
MKRRSLFQKLGAVAAAVAVAPLVNVETGQASAIEPESGYARILAAEVALHERGYATWGQVMEARGLSGTVAGQMQTSALTVSGTSTLSSNLTVQDGAVTAITVTNAGNGYVSSAPIDLTPYATTQPNRALSDLLTHLEQVGLIQNRTVG